MFSVKIIQSILYYLVKKINLPASNIKEYNMKHT